MGNTNRWNGEEADALIMLSNISMFSKSIAGAQQERSLYLWQKLSGWG